MNSPNDYLNELQQVGRLQDKAKLAALLRYYQSTLMRLPALKQEMDVFLQTDEMLDYEELLNRIEPTLEQATAWLLKVDYCL